MPYNYRIDLDIFIYIYIHTLYYSTHKYHEQSLIILRRGFAWKLTVTANQGISKQHIYTYPLHVDLWMDITYLSILPFIILFFTIGN